MSGQFGSYCDEFFVGTRLMSKLDLALGRETVLHFFERMRKEFPNMNKLRRRDDEGFILEEDLTLHSSRRWVRLESQSLRFGHVAPQDSSTLLEMAEIILEHAPYHLSFSDLDYDHMEVVYGFDLQYRGNHDRLVSETLWSQHPLYAFLDSGIAIHPIDAQIDMGVSLSETCDLQAYLEVKSRSSTYEIRTGQYEEQPLTVFLTIRKYWNVAENSGSLIRVHKELFDWAERLAAEQVVPYVVSPLAQAISRG